MVMEGLVIALVSVVVTTIVAPIVIGHWKKATSNKAHVVYGVVLRSVAL